MKKIYIIPAVYATQIEPQLLIADSPTAPNVIVDSSGNVNAEAVDVKGSSYNVWEDDWSK